jgi:hypothetical protein
MAVRDTIALMLEGNRRRMAGTKIGRRAGTIMAMLRIAAPIADVPGWSDDLKKSQQKNCGTTPRCAHPT